DGRKMSKSVGNVIAPKKVIDKYGAEILRLWVAASDYKDDIRISENILKQLSDAYRRIRNTSRFMLGNLYDFDPEKDSVAYDEMLEVDQYALHRLYGIIEKTRSAYDNYEFHVIYHALYNFCTLDLSAFYLDILKDRLYIFPPASVARRSAQTVMHAILDAMGRLMSPILPFTAEEIWKYMPGWNEEGESIHLQNLPVAETVWKNEALAQNWKLLLDIRGEVTKALEEARTRKLIGHPLDAAVTLSVDPESYKTLKPYAADLRFILIVSQADLTQDSLGEHAFQSEEIEGLSIEVAPSQGKKCERCWTHSPSVGSNEDFLTICDRCVGIVETLDIT
ncbi:MAG: class I tRNA ligase family protein, partial [Desulfobacterales bacterium]|nr:class I tRNA ligase family protein [Desulfobacterales bacterium]MDX2511049.1 class I tRNA ligase family protein [Desulfobacterales bacterium]